MRTVPTSLSLPPARPGRNGAGIACAAGVGAVLAMVLARAMLDGRVVYPGCGFLWLTGRPCPGCGGTHALAALGGGEPLAALAHNPLVTLFALASVALAAAAVLDRVLFRARLAARVAPRIGGIARHAGWWMAGAVAANWVYLLCVRG